MPAGDVAAIPAMRRVGKALRFVFDFFDFFQGYGLARAPHTFYGSPFNTSPQHFVQGFLLGNTPALKVCLLDLCIEKLRWELGLGRPFGI